jgi:HAD superfamily hydrolase (TIGR01509 family)
MRSRCHDLVLFDIGGVLARLEFEALAHVLRPGMDAAAWAHWMLGSRAATDFERGAASPGAFGAAVVAEVGASGATVAAVLAAFESWLVGPYPGALELVDETLGAGVAVGCLSNCNVVHAPRLTGMGLVPRFHPALFSHEIGLAKPDPAMYAAATARIDCAAARVLFLDDNVGNVSAGRAAGWTAAHVRGPAEARAALVEAGILTR